MIQVPSLPQALERGMRAEKNDRDESVLHVSDLAAYLEDGKCPRQLWLRLSGAEKKPPTAGQMLMFRQGSRMHEYIIPYLEAGLQALGEGDWHIEAIEEGVLLPGPTYGRFDARLTNGQNKIIVDFKTLRGRAFSYLQEPKPMHVLQVQGYIAGDDADGGLLFYLDREGQNQARQFYVQRDDERIREAIKYCMDIAKSETPPAYLQPKVKVGKNKGPDSVKLELPWQCSYCEYLDVACMGALPQNERNNGIIGYLEEGNLFKPKEGFEHLAQFVEIEECQEVPF